MLIDDLTARQILALKSQGAGDKEIADTLGIEEPLVALTLSRYENNSDRDIDDAQLAALRQRAVTLAMQESDLTVAARMTQFLIERDKPSKRDTQVSSITQINQQILASREAFEKLAESFNKP